MPEEWEADIELIRDVLEARKARYPAPRPLGWYEAIEALDRVKAALERVPNEKSQ